MTVKLPVYGKEGGTDGQAFYQTENGEIEIGGNGGTGIIKYGTLLLALNQKTQDTQNIFLSYNTRQASDIVVENTYLLKEPYDTCKMRVTERSPTPTIWDDLNFTSVGAIYTWLKTVATISGGIYQYDISIEFYDEIDFDIPAIDKVYGKNMFFSMLKGRKEYKKTRGTFPDTDHNEWSDYGKFMQDVIRQITPYTTYTQATGDGGETILWSPGNYRKLYGMPNMAGTIINNGNRGSTDGNGVVSVGATPVAEYSIIHYNSKYFYLDTNISGYSSINISSVGEYIDLLRLNRYSFIATYQVKYNNNYAVYIKPVGVDLLEIPYFDYNKYDLYKITYSRNKYKKLKKITGYISSQPYTNAVRISIDKWGDYNINSDMNGYYETDSIRLVLKDKTTGKISPLSSARIVFTTGNDKPLTADIKY